MPKPILDQSYLKKLLHYNEYTGEFTWKTLTSNRVHVGDISGCVRSKGYLQIQIDGHRYYAHRLAWLYVKGFFPNEIDHVDHNRSNNRFNNLRSVSPSENSRNQKLNPTNTSGVMGVDWCKGSNQWRSRIYHDNKSVHLGYFNDFFEACCARKSAQNKYSYHPNHGRK